MSIQIEQLPIGSPYKETNDGYFGQEAPFSVRCATALLFIILVGPMAPSQPS